MGEIVFVAVPPVVVVVCMIADFLRYLDGLSRSASAALEALHRFNLPAERIRQFRYRHGATAVVFVPDGICGALHRQDMQRDHLRCLTGLDLVAGPGRIDDGKGSRKFVLVQPPLHRLAVPVVSPGQAFELLHERDEHRLGPRAECICKLQGP